MSYDDAAEYDMPFHIADKYLHAGCFLFYFLFLLLLFYSAVLAIWFFDFIIFATSFWFGFAKGVSNRPARAAGRDECGMSLTNLSTQ